MIVIIFKHLSFGGVAISQIIMLSLVGISGKKVRIGARGPVSLV
jgi:hypothetical protein